MDETASVVTGSCLCRTVRWEARAPFFNMSHCHCSMCRKAHGAAFATYVGAKADGFRFVQGTDAIARYRSSSQNERCFCSLCGSVVPEAPKGQSVYMPAGCLDGDPGVRPKAHIFVASKAPWYTVPDSLPQHAQYPAEWNAPAVVAPEPDAPRIAASGKAVGSCLCGRVAYEVANDAWVAAYNCHCSRCRKARSAAHGTNGFVAPENFRWLQGDDHLRAFKVPEAERFDQAFCITCGSGMPRARPTRAVIPVATLDTAPSLPQLAHIFVGSKAPWFEIADSLRQFEQYPS
jgi:hypothetical protein